jgi:hypothetical protein
MWDKKYYTRILNFMCALLKFLDGRFYSSKKYFYLYYNNMVAGKPLDVYQKRVENKVKFKILTVNSCVVFEEHQGKFEKFHEKGFE